MSVTTDQIFGIACTGHLDETSMLSILRGLPPGNNEIHLRPTLPSDPSGVACGNQELAMLISPRIRAALEEARVPRGGFLDPRLARARDQ